MIPLSVLELATVATGSTPAQALRETTELAVVAERLGYERLWVAEHHGMMAVASSAPAVVIAHLADATTRIRVGAGGVMLPNHAPLVIAEQFATLEAFHPGRIDLGLGRAPGSDVRTARALRRDAHLSANSFPDDVVELISYLVPHDEPTTSLFATPGSVYLPEVWLLGSSTYSAQLAGMLGLPFSFAYHFAPDLLDAAISLYRSTFRPSILLERPHVMVAASVLCAPTSGEAAWLAGPSALSVLLRRTGQFGLLPSPEEAKAYRYNEEERGYLEQATASHLVGDPQRVREGLLTLQERTQADELMLSTRAHSLEARVSSLSLIAQSWGMTDESAPGPR